MIITADDFGISETVDKAIYDLILNNKIDGASVIVNLNRLTFVIEMIKNSNIKYIGFHFNITTGNLFDIENKNKFKNGDLSLITIFKEFKEQVVLLDTELKKINRKIDYVDSHFNILNFKYNNHFDLTLTLLRICEKIIGYKPMFRNENNSVELMNYDLNKDHYFVYCHPSLDVMEMDLQLEKLREFTSDNYIIKRSMDYLFLKNGGYEYLNKLRSLL